MINKLMIVAGFKEEKSFLKDAFFTRPFRIANVGQYKTDNSLYLMVMSSSPGLLDGDQYDVSIKVEAGVRLQLQSQAYQRLYKMKEGATQKISITLESGSAFSYVPHPVVPHRDSIFKSRTEVYLQEDCQLLLSEIITCGRKHSGEVFRFTYLQNMTEIYYKQKLVLKDNLVLQPQHVPPATIGQWECYTHQGTLIYLNTGKKPASTYLDEIQSMLKEEKDISFGLSETAANGFVLRILGNGGEQMFTCFKRVQDRLWSYSSIPRSKRPVSLETVSV